ncbi:ABC transporter permease subunit [Rhodococcus sp. HNM0563]|uniref:ABC transporter permease n=1 Tax=unclassified Rhodococcus (in: high G+C Gram-positive bacteria) TaxID=192944 RepID=UPI00146E8FE4|nr:ABC transporter permease subunit [Rhodococcus sp. F64268]MCK0090230.1 ABC transporter permease subunit [Rhodococcus sp. F64268]NLU61438.1 ABC transporter permease subunit [Rhodococcus sp. HNM0563]
MNAPSAGTRSPQYALGAALCVAVLLGVWHWLSLGQSPAVMPSPAQTLEALWEILSDGSLPTELAITLLRAGTATVLALCVGLLFGWAATVSRFADGVLAPIRAILQGLPPIVLIVCLVLWMGSDPSITIIVCATVMVPLIAAATASALQSVDPHLLELGTGLQLSRSRRLVFIVAPSILPPIVATTGAVASGSVRVAVMAELLSAPDGVGAAIAQTRTLLQTPKLFAWTLAIIVCALLVDLAIRVVVKRWTALFSPSDRAATARTRTGTRIR